MVFQLAACPPKTPSACSERINLNAPLLETKTAGDDIFFTLRFPYRPLSLVLPSLYRPFSILLPSRPVSLLP